MSRCVARVGASVTRRSPRTLWSRPKTRVSSRFDVSEDETLFDGIGHEPWKARRAVRYCTMIDRDDVAVLLAVAREGSVWAVAERLGVNHSTVLRRIAQLEERLGAQIFEKLPFGLSPDGCQRGGPRVCGPDGSVVTRPV